MARKLTGQRFNKWTVLKYAGLDAHFHLWLCRCECGREKIVRESNLINGRSKTCGCSNRIRLAARNRANAKYPPDTKVEWQTWRNMMKRCNDPTNKFYANYGGRGIKVCKAWRDFNQFFSDMGRRPEGYTLDRIENDKGYSPSNCRWATRVTQSRNRRSAVMLTHNGETRTVAEWALITGMPEGTIHVRIKYKWPVEKVLTAPVRRSAPK